MFRFSMKGALALVAGLSVSAVALAGARSGFSAANFSIRGGVRVAHEKVFYGGEEALIVVKGHGDADLDLFVYDEAGRQLGCDEDDTNYCVVRCMPTRTQRLKIVVKNCDSWSDTYTLGHN
jgi:hypothetical protein